MKHKYLTMPSGRKVAYRKFSINPPDYQDASWLREFCNQHNFKYDFTSDGAFSKKGTMPTEFLGIACLRNGSVILYELMEPEKPSDFDYEQTRLLGVLTDSAFTTFFDPTRVDAQLALM